MSTSNDSDWFEAVKVEDLEKKEVMVVHGAGVPVAVFVHDGKISACDNRCPHLGFPLHKGTVEDGILPCHWHQARFDLCSGGTFDLFADDVPVYKTEVKDGIVHVATNPTQLPDRGYYLRRLRKGMEQNIGGIIAKSVGSLHMNGGDDLDIIRSVAEYGSGNHDNWGDGMTTLSMVTNLLPYLSDETAYYALFLAARRVAANCAGATPRRLSEPLNTGEHSKETLKRWFRRWVHARRRAGAERVALTAVEAGLSSAQMTDFYFGAATDRLYSATGHVFDLSNKAFELIDSLGEETAPDLLPLLMSNLSGSRGAEEDASWRHPVEIVEPLMEVSEQLPQILNEGEGKSWEDDGSLTETLLGDEPLAIIEALTGALRSGAAPAELSKRVAYVAAMRLARFSPNNEVGDWFNPQHTFTYTNAVHQAVKRSPSSDVIRGVYHGAISVYMDRFLNVPPAKMPGQKDSLDKLPTDAQELRDRFLDVLNHREEVDAASCTVARYVQLGHPFEPLVETLTYATVREDVDFHYLQVLEGAVQQFQEWDGQPEAEHIMVGVARNLAAACPTRRAGLQVANVALRLNRGEKIYEDD